MWRKWDQSQESSVRRRRMGKNCSLPRTWWTPVPWGTLNLQNTSRSTKERVVLLGGQRRRRRRMLGGSRRAKVLQRLGWQRHSSWTLSESPPDCYDSDKKSVLKFWSGFFHDKKPNIWNSIDDPVVLLERNFLRSPVGWLSFGQESRRNDILKRDGKKYHHGNVSTCTKSSDYSYRFMWTISKWLERSRTWVPCGKCC